MSDTEARPFGRAQLPVFENELVVCQLLPEARLAELRREELEERHVRRDHRELRRYGDRDPGLPSVRDDQSASVGCEVANATRFGQAPDASDVGLRHLHAALVDQHLEVVAGREPLARRNRDG